MRSITVDVQDNRYSIRGRGDEFVPDGIQCLSEQRIKVTEFKTESPNLEDVFLRLTGIRFVIRLRRPFRDLRDSRVS